MTGVFLYDEGVPTTVAFTIVSSEELTFNAPDRSGPGDSIVRVNSPEGIAESPLTYYNPGPPVITSVNPSVLSYRNTTNFIDVVVSGQNFLGATSVRLTADASLNTSDPDAASESSLPPPSIASDTQLTIRVSKLVRFQQWYVRVTTPLGESPTGPACIIRLEFRLA